MSFTNTGHPVWAKGGGMLFTKEWQERYAPIVERSMVATIEIFVPGERIWDQETDTWSSNDEIIYGPLVPDAQSDGRARIQPVRASKFDYVPGNNTDTQNVLISIPVRYNDIDVRPKMQIRVLASPLNTLLMKYQYVFNEIMDSSNPIERTLYCTVNQEVVVK